MGKDLPAAGRAVLRHPFGVDGDHDALIAEFLRRLAHEAPVVHRRRVDRHLVGPGKQQLADVLNGAHAAADRERHETGLGRAPDHVEQDAARLVARGDVEKTQLVRARGVVDLRGLDRIAGVAQIDEAHALDDAPVLDVEAGDEADFEHGRDGQSKS